MSRPAERAALSLCREGVDSELWRPLVAKNDVYTLDTL